MADPSSAAWDHDASQFTFAAAAAGGGGQQCQGNDHNGEIGPFQLGGERGHQDLQQVQAGSGSALDAAGLGAAAGPGAGVDLAQLLQQTLGQMNLEDAARRGDTSR